MSDNDDLQARIAASIRAQQENAKVQMANGAVLSRAPIPQDQWKFDPNAVAKSHCGILTTIFHQQPHEPPVVLDARHTKLLDSTEQAYQRKVTLDLDWVPIDLGWFKDNPGDVGLVAIKNEEGRFNAMPTEQERDEMARRVIRIGFHPEGTHEVCPLFLVRPGEMFHGVPAQLRLLRLASLSGRTRCTIMVVPN